MKLSTRTLQSLKDDAALVDVWRDGLSGDSALGLITDYNDLFVYMSLFNDHDGTANGIAVFWRDDVSRIRWGGHQCDAVASLMRAQGSRPSAPKLQLDTVDSILRSVHATYGYVNVLTERIRPDCTYIGEIEELDDESLLLMAYGTHVSRDRGHVLLRIDDITRVDADAPYERGVHFLATGEMPKD